ncbi:hypothetical protein [Micromonospora chalcea]|uniref:hypothetical protein n=1 Tax=Micromonospora chalcea TaxID=1874 RepID=UPI003D7121D6
MFTSGDRVINIDTRQTSIPTGAIGTVVPDVICSYGVTVLWDGHELYDSHGPRGFRPYMDTARLRHMDPRKHAVYGACDHCGGHNKDLADVPNVTCRDCGARLFVADGSN